MRWGPCLHRLCGGFDKSCDFKNEDRLTAYGLESLRVVSGMSMKDHAASLSGFCRLVKPCTRRLRGSALNTEETHARKQEGGVFGTFRACAKSQSPSIDF